MMSSFFVGVCRGERGEGGQQVAYSRLCLMPLCCVATAAIQVTYLVAMVGAAAFVVVRSRWLLHVESAAVKAYRTAEQAIMDSRYRLRVQLVNRKRGQRKRSSRRSRGRSEL